jgi:hypothetical protein
MIDAFSLAMAGAFAVVVGLWLIRKGWRVLIWIAYLLAPYGFIRFWQISRGIAREYRDHMDREEEQT